MTSERSKRRDFLALVFISKSISKKLLIKMTNVLVILYIQTAVLFLGHTTTVFSQMLQNTVLGYLESFKALLII